MAGLNPRRVAEVLGGEAHGDQVSAPGPGHSRQDRSLSVKIDDLAPDGFLAHSHAGDDGLICKDFVREKLGHSPTPLTPVGGSGGDKALPRLGLVIAEYIYMDANRAPVLKVKRYDPKTFRQFHWDGAVWASGGIEQENHVPYRLPDIIEAMGREASVYIAEGEKAADALAARGLAATCSPGGAGKWPDHFAQWFHEADVVVLPDNDEPGRRHAIMVAANLSPVSRRVRVIDLPGLPEKGDASDWLETGGDPDQITDLPEQQTTDEPSPWYSLADLMDRVFEPGTFVVHGLISPGLTILAGPPKLGKSWMALAWAIAVAAGEVFSDGVPCDQGDVLYAALEDTPRRLQDRVKKLIGKERPKGTSFINNLPRADQGGVDIVRAWIMKAERPKLVIIDTFAKVKRQRSHGENGYDADYTDVTIWKSLADEFNIAIMLIHHVRKMGAEDRVEMVSGTYGLTGAADAILVLSRDAQGVTLSGRGRDLEEFERVAEFNKFTSRWSLKGETAEERISEERRAVLEHLHEVGEKGLTPKELAALMEIDDNRAKQFLHQMAKAGQIARGVGRGRYCHPDYVQHE